MSTPEERARTRSGERAPAGVAGGAAADRPSSPPGREAGATSRRRDRTAPSGNMLPGRSRRRLGAERLLVRLIATGGVIGISVALGAILTSNKVAGWIIGLVIAIVSIVLSAILWSSRQL